MTAMDPRRGDEVRIGSLGYLRGRDTPRKSPTRASPETETGGDTTVPAVGNLVLLRHGQSKGNDLRLFTGWHDVDLTPRGEREARQAGRLLRAEGLEVDVVHTSLQRRAIRTANLALEALDRLWIPTRRHWRLNQRHCGTLQGRSAEDVGAEHGEDQVQRWRRSYDTPPPPLSEDDPRHPRYDPRYAMLPPDLLPATECLHDVVRRTIPYWHDNICVDLIAGRRVLVAGHGNSLRALVKHLDQISDADIPHVEIRAGVPLVYELNDRLHPVDRRFLTDPSQPAGGEAETDDSADL